MIHTEQREAPSIHPTRRLSLGFLFVLAAAAYQLFCAFQSVVFLNVQVLAVDDAFYYFQVARRWAQLGWATFDGIHQTSGVQLAWGLILAALARLVDDRLAFLRAVLVLSVALNVLTGLLLCRLGHRMHSPRAGVALGAIWSGFMLALSPTLLGLEYSLYALVLVAVVDRWWTISNQAAPVRPIELAVLGVLLTFMYWVRLDAAVLSLLVWLAVVGRLLRTEQPPREKVTQVLALSLPPVVGILPYAAVCLYLAGTPVPLSGIVKNYYADHHFDQFGWWTAAAGHLLWWIEIQVQPINELFAAVFPLVHPSDRSAGLAVPLAALMAATAWGIKRIMRSRDLDARTDRLARFIGVMTLFGFVHTASIVAAIGPFSHVTQHYYAWTYLTWFLWGALLIDMFLTSLPAGRRAQVAALAVAVSVAAHVVIARGRFDDTGWQSDVHTRRLDVAAWMSEQLGPGATVGAWNAGEVAYFCDCDIVNLDGLMNDREFFAFLREGRPLIEYLKRERIAYLVDYAAPNMTMPYRAEWDRSRLFLNAVPWSELRVVHTSPHPVFEILVLRVIGVDAGPGKP